MAVACPDETTVVNGEGLLKLAGSADQKFKCDPSVSPGKDFESRSGEFRIAMVCLQVRSRYESIAGAALRCQGYTWLLPTYRCRRQWSDRIKETELPLFPGYLFCRFDLQHRLPILKIPGFISIVGTGKTPLPIDEGEITALRTAVNGDHLCQPWPYLKIGERVRIKHGSLSGLEGILIASKSHCRLVLSVTLLQRSVATEIDSAWVEPIPEPVASRPGNMTRPSGQFTAHVSLG